MLDLIISFANRALSLTSSYKRLLSTDIERTWTSNKAFFPAETATTDVFPWEYPIPGFTTITLVILLSSITGLKIAPVPTPETTNSGVE